MLAGRRAPAPPPPQQRAHRAYELNELSDNAMNTSRKLKSNEFE
jgi:hypothetical protein